MLIRYCVNLLYYMVVILVLQSCLKWRYWFFVLLIKDTNGSVKFYLAILCCSLEHFQSLLLMALHCHWNLRQGLQGFSKHLDWTYQILWLWKVMFWSRGTRHLRNMWKSVWWVYLEFMGSIWFSLVQFTSPIYKKSKFMWCIPFSPLLLLHSWWSIKVFVHPRIICGFLIWH